MRAELVREGFRVRALGRQGSYRLDSKPYTLNRFRVLAFWFRAFASHSDSGLRGFTSPCFLLDTALEAEA